MTIEPFIALGWHTVPLGGSLLRLDDGTKTVPMYPKNWRVIYTENKNTKVSDLGGAITGVKSNILAVDCDNPTTYALFKSLDPDYEADAKSLGKYDEPTGTLVYEYDEDLPDTFSVHEDHGLSLDFYSNNGFIYLPTVGNKTKEPWETIPEIRKMPDGMKLIISQLAKKNIPIELTQSVNIMTANCLAPLVEQFIANDKFMPGLFRIITPRDFRSLTQYVNEGYLHPNNVPEGRGSEYMSKVSAILGADVSVDETMYVQAMMLINGMWDDPIEDEIFDKTVVNPMIEGQSSINGVPLWKYNPDWEQFVCVLPSKRQSTLELGFDDARNMYYCVDTANETHKAFGRDSEFFAYLEAAAHNVPKKVMLKKVIPIVNVISDPANPFGFASGDDPTARNLNLFSQSPELAILHNPETYEQHYKAPILTLKYLQTLVPEERMYNFLMQFTKRKLLTFKYSPVILYFLGAQGSGKDMFVELIEKIVRHVSRPTTKEFLEMYNGYMLDNYFVQLDEYGNQLSRMADKEEALGKLKAYSGKQTITVRTMRTDGFSYKHRATFIMTANTQPLVLEDGDRRIAFFATPTKLENTDWVKEAGGIATVHDKIMEEAKDFCYYLATEVPDLHPSAYVSPPASQHKHKLIADSMFAGQKIVYSIKYAMWQYLIDLGTEHGVPMIEDDIRAQRITTTSLEELYNSITDFKGDFKTVMKNLRAYELELKPTTTNGQRSYYVDVEIPPFLNEDSDDETML